VTSITLTTGQGARFPSLAGGDYFFATLIDTSNNLEIVKCTARSTDVLTVVRGQESTTARAFSTGDRIELRVTAQGLVDASGDLASGVLAIPGTSASGAIARLYEDTDNGTNYIGIKAPASVASNLDFTLPSVDGSAGQFLKTNGSGVLSFDSLPTAKVINVERIQNSTRASLSSGSPGSPATLVTFTYNKQSASTSLLFIVMIPLWSNNAGSLACDLTYGTSSAFGSLSYTYTALTYGFPMQGQATLTGYTTTGSQTLTVRHYAVGGSGAPSSLVNPNASDDARNIQQVSTVTVIEYS
jgi:hypothetical protein